jgi:AcrR family transcriptional regulator
MIKSAKAEAARAKASPENRKVRLMIDAARRFFVEKDYDTSTMDAIARDAGVSKATLYAHFSSKEELLLALVKDEFSTVSSLWAPTPGPIDVEQGLWSLARAVAKVISGNHAVPTHRLIMTYGPRFPEVAEVFLANGPPKHRREVAAFLRAAAAQGRLVLPDPDLAAGQFLSLLIGDLPMRRALGQAMPSASEFEAIAASAIRVFLAAYAAPKRRAMARRVAARKGRRK